MLTRWSYPPAQLRLQRSQRLAARHKSISDIHRLFFQKLRANELSNLIENLKKLHKNHHFCLVLSTVDCSCSGITLRADDFRKSALRITCVGPASRRHLGSEKRPKSARNRVLGRFPRNPDFLENRAFVLPIRWRCPALVDF